MYPRIAVITAHNRPELLAQCVLSLAGQCDRIFIIDNASDPPIAGIPGKWTEGNFIRVIRDEEQPPNLSRLWNRGLDTAHEFARLMSTDECYDVAVFGDDVIVPTGWWERVSYALRSTTAVLAGTHGIAPIWQALLKTEPDSDIVNRIPGWAWMLRGEVCLRLDESLQWWFGDTDLDWRARQAGGSVIAPGAIAVNQRPNEFTVTRPELTRQAGFDRITFSKKWGWTPW